MRLHKNTKRRITILLLVAFLAGLFVPFRAYAEKEKEQKVVRVGWFDSSFCHFDQFGRRCGIDYEYHQKISAYTGWTFEYVEDSWPNLLQKLKAGEIDLLSDVSYRADREQYMYFSELPMGTEAYYIFVRGDNREITAADLGSFNGKRIGVNKDSVQENFLKEWITKNGLSVEIVPLTLSENESMEMVVRGEIDGYASIFTYDYQQELLPITRIGGADYFYAVNKDRKDLLEELNYAMTQIQDEDPYYNERISKQRLFETKTAAMLTSDIEDWISAHGAIRVGYREDYLPFCSKDEKTGELTGALKDFLAGAKNNLNSPNLEFETFPYATLDDALKALEAGEVDCVFPVYLSTYDADRRGLRITEPAMKTEMNAVMRVSNRETLSEDSTITFAINANMYNIETFIMDYYPNTKRVSYQGLPACYDAVSKGDADCVLLSNYRILAQEETLDKLNLYTVPTGETLEFSFAVRKTDREMYLLLNKASATTKNGDMDSALASYMVAENKTTFLKFLKENWLIVLAVVTVVFAVILSLLGSKLRTERLASKQRRMLEEAAQLAELEQTVSSLLDNMPGLYFSKEAESGKYIACNQAFASYVNKKDPSEVVGHTTGDLFDAEMTKQFLEDDETALSMEEPLIYYDNMENKHGNLLKVKITRLKYKDADGRLCLLGLFQDVSDSFRISRGKASTKESYEKARNDGLIFTHIAQTLANEYLILYYIDVNTEEYIEYRTSAEDGSLVETRRGWHFFEECLDVAESYVVQEERAEVEQALDRKTLVAALDQGDAFMMTFRILLNQEPKYVSLKVNRMQDDDRFLILSITDVDEQVKHRQAAQRMQEEQTAYDRVSALAGDFLCIYVVAPENGRFREYSSSAGFDAFTMPKEGDNFFSAFRESTIRVVYPEDQNRVFTALTMENALEEIENNGMFTLTYRMVKDDEPRYVQLKAAVIEEQDGRRLIVGVNDIDAQVRQEEEYGRRLAQARIEANIDALTGVKNRNAYRVYEERLNAQIEMDRAPEFAIVLLDVNDLKLVNDTQGHKAGDQYLRDACKVICSTFKRSPVFRVGGDEFVALAQGDDLNRLDELVQQMNEHNDEAVANGGIVIALGVSRYEHDEKVARVYERADHRMYENKSALKARKK